MNNTPRVQAQVRYLLETMRRVQDVQIVTETRIISLNAGSYAKLQELLPQLKKDGHVVLNGAEAFALIRKAQDNAGAKVIQAPKITFFPGQRVSLSMAPGEESPGIKKTDIKLDAMIAANLQHIELDVGATVGKAEFKCALRLEDGMTLAQIKRIGVEYLIVLVTPRVVFNLEEDEVASPKAK